MTNRLGFASAIALALALVELSGCGGGSTVPIVCSGTQTTCVAPEFLYATAQGHILGFTVNQNTGALSVPTTTPVPGLSMGGVLEASLGIVSLSPQGFLYVSDTQNNQVDGFAVNNTTGALTTMAGSPFSLRGPSGVGLSGFPVGMVIDPAGKFLYVAGVFIDAFSINPSTGSLTEVPGSPFPGGGLEITVDPSGRFLYSTLVNLIFAYAVDSNTGALTPMAGSPFALPAQNLDAFGLVVDSTGHFIYVSADSFPLGDMNEVDGYSIDATSGALTLIFGSPASTDIFSPLAIATSASFLFVGHAQGTEAFNIAPGSGVLSEVTGSPFAAGSARGGMVVSPDGKFLYEAGPGAINVFAINSTTGAISVTGSPTTAARPLALTLYRP